MTTLRLADLCRSARRQLGLDTCRDNHRCDGAPVRLPVVSICRPAQTRPSDGAMVCPALSLPIVRHRNWMQPVRVPVSSDSLAGVFQDLEIGLVPDGDKSRVQAVTAERSFASEEACEAAFAGFQVHVGEDGEDLE